MVNFLTFSMIGVFILITEVSSNINPQLSWALLLGSDHLLSSQVNPVALTTSFTTSFSDPISLGSTLHHHLLRSPLAPP
ncbi:hypothetical protein EDD85DRAFT_809509 [Armillaria nabsnona]|nr:hypothetical protein EDD85DRAFT_809509 [Armillaria nabsnona]